MTAPEPGAVSGASLIVIPFAAPKTVPKLRRLLPLFRT